MPDDPEEQEDGEDTWEFTAGGNSCAVCMSMDGQIFPEEPPRPHDSCDCDITPTSESSDECDNSWDITNVETVRTPGSDTLEFNVDIHVECWDGATHDTTITIDMTDTYNGYRDDDLDSFLDDMESLIFDEVADEAEEFMAQSCRKCKGDDDFPNA